MAYSRKQRFANLSTLRNLSGNIEYNEHHFYLYFCPGIYTLYCCYLPLSMNWIQCCSSVFSLNLMQDTDAIFFMAANMISFP